MRTKFKDVINAYCVVDIKCCREIKKMDNAEVEESKEHNKNHGPCKIKNSSNVIFVYGGKREAEVKFINFLYDDPTSCFWRPYFGTKESDLPQFEYFLKLDNEKEILWPLQIGKRQSNYRLKLPALKSLKNDELLKAKVNILDLAPVKIKKFKFKPFRQSSWIFQTKGGGILLFSV